VKRLQEAARERLARLKIVALVDELDGRHGTPSPGLRREVDRAAKRIFKRPRR